MVETENSGSFTPQTSVETLIPNQSISFLTRGLKNVIHSFLPFRERGITSASRLTSAGSFYNLIFTLDGETFNDMLLGNASAGDRKDTAFGYDIPIGRLSVGIHTLEVRVNRNSINDARINGYHSTAREI